ncbi:hypothetical protein CDD83_297 [Cordyceps sp. RAO-2017]|nr:hypothetical protein CDD83_297 [Cordyceps sp. RAO-2017]
MAIVQSRMMDSILSSILLILGSSFVLAGLNAPVVGINADVAGILTSLMIISCAALIMPSALHISDPGCGNAGSDPSDDVLALSRFASLVLLIFYLLYLYFQSVTHADLLIDDSQEADHELHAVSNCVVLVLSALGVATCSDRQVHSIDGFVKALGLSRSFVGLIIVPIVGNLGCFVGTVEWSRTNRIQLAISVIVSSTLQISLFVTPLLVVVGWVIDQKMSLQFDTFQTTVLTISTLVVNCLVRDGETNYFEGVLLVATCVCPCALA